MAAAGLSVLTAGYLAAGGTCCGGGCRHCPYVGGGEATERIAPTR